ncbi:SPOR domain-containing protein [Campylobacter sp. JMF_08 NE1]|uniref:SPOR domain-containing protein n=1 Tax=Campylobacter sp. JMF_08 NE1 TaxID=2983821 RepID=UPI0022E9B7BB|nr:SPOR domain-containing protein [Campylobacter sp. JMF_08 NE1]MDA3048724.1 hypothetical protein [Campylobacter sp. JMF_08 NE1]
MTDKFDMSDITMNGAPGDGTASLKKLLTIAAGIIVLFLIVLIIMKAINKNDIDTNAALTMPSEEELTKKEEVKKEPEINVVSSDTSNAQPQTPAPKAEPTPAPKPSELQISKVEIKSEVKDEPKPVVQNTASQTKVEIKKPEVKEEPKPVEIKKEEPKPVVVQRIEVKKEEPKPEEVKTVKEQLQAPKVEIKKEAPKVEVKKEASKTEPKKAEVKKVEVKKDESKKVEAKKPEPKKEEVKKAEVKKETPKTEPKKEPAKVGTAAKTANSSVGAGNYIQVFASNSYDPNSSDVRKITAKGYNPVGLKTQVNGKDVVKILVGPFSGEELNKAISDMRTLNSGAYIYRVK